MELSCVGLDGHSQVGLLLAGQIPLLLCYRAVISEDWFSVPIQREHDREVATSIEIKRRLWE